jgi:fatty-acyl-CoA synthase
MTVDSPNSSSTMNRSIVSFFLQNATRQPTKPFLKLELPHEKGTVSYGEMRELASRRGAELLAAGASHGGVVLIFMPQGSLGLSYFIGAMMAGFVPSFMPCPSAKQDPVHYWGAHKALFERIKPVALVANPDHAADIVAQGLTSDATKLVVASPLGVDTGGLEIVRATPETTAFLQHSSGTTGQKKGVMLSHGAVLEQIEAYAEATQSTEHDVVASWLPVYHDMGLIACFIMPLVLGQTIVLLDPFHWVSRPATLFRAIAAHSATLCWMPNFAFEHIANLVRPDPDTMGLGGMRAFINCSEPCQAASFARFADRFAVLGVRPEMLQICYAMAETVFAVSQTSLDRPPRVLTVDRRALAEEARVVPPQADQATTVLVSNGKPVGGGLVSIRDQDGRDLPEGHVGEISIAAKFLFSGYYNMPEKTAEKLQGQTYRTSDRGFLVDGEVYVLGRFDDLLILNGRNFHAAEIESLLSGVDGIKPGRNVAFARYNDETGSSELIVVCERADEIPQETVRLRIRKIVFDELGLHPADIALVAPGWLAKTTSGKIARGRNAERYALLQSERSLGST